MFNSEYAELKSKKKEVLLIRMKYCFPKASRFLFLVMKQEKNEKRTLTSVIILNSKYNVLSYKECEYFK